MGKEVIIKLWIEPKEDVTPEGIQPNDPEPFEVANAIRDTLSYETRDDPFIGWRITHLEG